MDTDISDLAYQIKDLCSRLPQKVHSAASKTVTAESTQHIEKGNEQMGAIPKALNPCLHLRTATP